MLILESLKSMEKTTLLHLLFCKVMGCCTRKWKSLKGHSTPIKEVWL